jgi:3-dehydroquinate dehydratase/shikimate dehydrogenase
MSSTTHKICVSLMPTDTAQLNEMYTRCNDADLIEIRLDHISSADLQSVFAEYPKPVIAALRTENEGGYWQGSMDSYTKAIQNAIHAGAAYVDVSLEYSKKVLPKLETGACKIILSHHTTSNDEAELQQILGDMLTIPADIYKLVYTAQSLNDNTIAFRLAKKIAEKGHKFVIHAMGEPGRQSRLLGPIYGNEWTYTALLPNQSTAPGQPALHEAVHFYFLKYKSSTTKILGLVGNPIAHSRGWRMHNQLIYLNFTLKENNPNSSDFIYINFPTEDFETFWHAWEPYLHGLSITIPFKEKIVPFLKHATSEVLISGVCNTVVRTNNGWHGYNTDMQAIEELLKPYKEELKKGGLVIGTGATARSAIAALKRLEVDPIFVIGRNNQRGKMLMRKYNVDFLELDEVHYASAAVIIQTTPVGMAPYTDQYPPGTSLFRKNRVVLDVIYNPAETRFLKIARERGCLTISGVNMFLLQAIKQFRLFTGVEPSVKDAQIIWENIH